MNYMSLELVKLQRVLQEFRSLDKEMQAQTMLAFLYIAERDTQGVETTVLDVGTYLDLTSASATRNVQALSKVHRYGKDGHNLVFTEENPKKRTEKFIYLTDKGKSLTKRLEGYIHVSQTAK
jgi:DNA-binding MarR family transcriptional regulator